MLDEAEYGLKKKVYVPALIEDTDPPLGFGQIQAAKLIGWHGDIDHLQYRLSYCCNNNSIKQKPGPAV